MNLCTICQTEPLYRRRRCKACYVEYMNSFFHCTFNTCIKPVFAATLCQYHYRHWRVTCIQCTKPVYCRSLCRNHYRKAAALKRFPKEPECRKCNKSVFMDRMCIKHFKEQFKQSCIMVNCQRSVHKRGLCCAHYFQDRRS
jgi:hypothetical protein